MRKRIQDLLGFVLTAGVGSMALVLGKMFPGGRDSGILREAPRRPFSREAPWLPVSAPPEPLILRLLNNTAAQCWPRLKMSPTRPHCFRPSAADGGIARAYPKVNWNKRTWSDCGGLTFSANVGRRFFRPADTRFQKRADRNHELHHQSDQPRHLAKSLARRCFSSETLLFVHSRLDCTNKATNFVRPKLALWRTQLLLAMRVAQAQRAAQRLDQRVRRATAAFAPCRISMHRWRETQHAARSNS